MRTRAERVKTRTGQVHLLRRVRRDRRGLRRRREREEVDLDAGSPARKRHQRPPRRPSAHLVLQVLHRSRGARQTRSSPNGTRTSSCEIPQWWGDPATDAQIGYLTGVMDQREVPEALRRQIEAGVENATKGAVSTWLSLLDVAPWRPRDTDQVVTLGPREIVH